MSSHRRLVMALSFAACAPKPRAAPVVAAPPTKVAALPLAHLAQGPGCLELCTRPASETHTALLRYVAALQSARSADEAKKADAVRQLERLLHDAPWFAPAYRVLGQALSSRGSWVPAYVAYKHYLEFELYPRDRERVLSDLGALEAKQPALAAYAAGERAAEQGDWDRAIRQMQDVLQQKESFSLAHRLLGRGQALERRHFDAIDAFERYLQLEVDAPDRADIMRRIADERAAVPALRQRR